MEHIALEDVRRSTTSADAKDDKREQQSGVIPQGSRPGTADSNVEEADIELREAYKLYKVKTSKHNFTREGRPLQEEELESTKIMRRENRMTTRERAFVNEFDLFCGRSSLTRHLQSVSAAYSRKIEECMLCYLRSGTTTVGPRVVVFQKAGSECRGVSIISDRNIRSVVPIPKQADFSRHSGTK